MIETFGYVPDSLVFGSEQCAKSPTSGKAAVSFDVRMKRADAAWKLVRAEIERAARKHPAFNSHHEGYAVLLEEVDELWDDVKADQHAPAAIEAVQVAAMAVRFLTDCSAWEMQTSPGGCYLDDAVPVLTATKAPAEPVAMVAPTVPGNSALTWLRRLRGRR